MFPPCGGRANEIIPWGSPRAFGWWARAAQAPCAAARGVLVSEDDKRLVIACGPPARASELSFSIALSPKHPTVFFARGAELPDPTKRLRGSGTAIRHIVLDEVAV